MSVVLQISAIQVILHALKDKVYPNLWNKTALPVVAAPGSWLKQVANELGQAEDMIPQFIHHCPVVQDDTLDEPVMITHDEKVYRVNAYIPDRVTPDEPVERKRIALVN